MISSYRFDPWKTTLLSIRSSPSSLDLLPLVALEGLLLHLTPLLVLAEDVQPAHHVRPAHGPVLGNDVRLLLPVVVAGGVRVGRAAAPDVEAEELECLLSYFSFMQGTGFMG